MQALVNDGHNLGENVAATLLGMGMEVPGDVCDLAASSCLHTSFSWRQNILVHMALQVDLYRMCLREILC